MVAAKNQTHAYCSVASSEKANHTFVLDYFEREEILNAARYYTSSANQTALRPDDPYASHRR